MKFEQITKVRLPYDRRHSDPHKNYGIHGLDVWFILKGPKGAVQFAVTFGIYLPHVQAELLSTGFPYLNEVRGFDVGYHAFTPQFEGQSAHSDCDFLEGGCCYYDGSGLRADEWAAEIFAVRGAHPEDEIWKRLEQEYKERFEVPA